MNRPGQLRAGAVALLLGAALIGILAWRREPRSARPAGAVANAGTVTDSGWGADSATRVEATLRAVRYQIDPDITLDIRRLEGTLIPVARDSPPVFDDPASFAIRVRNAEIAIDTASLGRLLTRHVFAYEGSPLRELSVSVRDGELRQQGKLKKVITLPFSIQARASVTEKGEIRLTPSKVEVLGMGVRRLMDLFRLELDDLVKSNRSHGVRIVEDEVFLDPGALLPPPRIQGKLTGLRLEADRIVQLYGRADHPSPPVRVLEGRRAPHYMYFRHARLRFGKLTMHNTDMLVVDAEPETPFAFSLDRYHEQLVAGYHLTTAQDGLVVYMPDVTRLAPRRPGTGSRP